MAFSLLSKFGGLSITDSGADPEKPKSATKPELEIRIKRSAFYKASVVITYGGDSVDIWKIEIKNSYSGGTRKFETKRRTGRSRQKFDFPLEFEAGDVLKG